MILDLITIYFKKLQADLRLNKITSHSDKLIADVKIIIQH